MLLWTIVPLETIFNEEQAQDKTPKQYQNIEYSNILLEVEEISQTEKKIVRVISSDPNDFLRPELQPGSVLKYQLSDMKI